MLVVKDSPVSRQCLLGCGNCRVVRVYDGRQLLDAHPALDILIHSLRLGFGCMMAEMAYPESYELQKVSRLLQGGYIRNCYTGGMHCDKDGGTFVQIWVRNDPNAPCYKKVK